MDIFVHKCYKYILVSIVQPRIENIPAVLKYAAFGTGPFTVMGGVEVNYYLLITICNLVKNAKTHLILSVETNVVGG